MKNTPRLRRFSNASWIADPATGSAHIAHTSKSLAANNFLSSAIIAMTGEERYRQIVRPSRFA